MPETFSLFDNGEYSYNALVRTQRGVKSTVICPYKGEGKELCQAGCAAFEIKSKTEIELHCCKRTISYTQTPLVED